MSDKPLWADPDDLAAVYRATVKLLREDRPIEAVKYLRASMGLGLKEARDLMLAIRESISAIEGPDKS